MLDNNDDDDYFLVWNSSILFTASEETFASQFMCLVNCIESTHTLTDQPIAN